MTIKITRQRLLSWLLLILLIANYVGTFAPTPLFAANLSASKDAQARQVDQLFAAFIDKDSPGAAVIVIQNGKVRYKAAYGLADVERGIALTPQHFFHIASIGKQFTAIGIMQLAQEGKLYYDDPIRHYFPELPTWGDRITIRQLLNHTSGLPDYTDAILAFMFARADIPNNVDLLAALGQRRRLASVPGAEFNYSNVGYDLLGSLIERVSGQTFPIFMQNRIFAPLGMKQTFSLPNPTRRKKALIAHSYEAADSEPYDFDPLDDLVGAGSVYTTVDDMALYDQALYTDKLVKQATLRDAFQAAVLNDGSKSNYGFAFELEKWQKRPYVAHNGAWLAFESDYVRFAEEKLSVIVLLNRSYDNPEEPRIGLQIAKVYLQ